MTFCMDPKLLTNSTIVADWNLCKVILKNEKHYPWFLLIPKKDNLVELTELSKDEQATLMQETNRLAEFVQHHFKTDKINIASIGNMVPQFHMHVVGRFKTDPLWPQSIWQAAYQERPYADEEFLSLSERVKTTLSI